MVHPIVERNDFFGVLTMTSDREAGQTYGVWWSSAGCLPDTPEPEFTGTLAECEKYIAEQIESENCSAILANPSNLYSFSIEPWEE